MRYSTNTLRPRRNEQHFADDIFKRIFFNENVWISIKISLKFVSKGPINNIPAMIQIMAWRRSGDRPLSEPMMVSLPTHICVTRPQWVKPIGDKGRTDAIISTHKSHPLSQLPDSVRWADPGQILWFQQYTTMNIKVPDACVEQRVPSFKAILIRGVVFIH